MLYAFLDGRQVSVKTAKIERKIDAADSVVFTVPLSNLYEIDKDYQGMPFSLYFRDIALIDSGIIQKPDIGDNASGSVVDMTFTAMGELGQLAMMGAASNANYQDEYAIFIIYHLLSEVSDNWTLGYFEGFDTSIKLTIDLRKKDTILAQLKELFTALPDYYFRYGGLVNEKYTLDVGPLNDYASVQLTQGQNVESIKRTLSARQSIYRIEAFGGIFEQKQTVNIEYLDHASNPAIFSYDETIANREIYLQDAYDYDPTLTTNETFPLVQLPNGRWYVEDVAFPFGRTIRKDYESAKPTNDPLAITASDIELAGYTLYKMAVDDLIKANEQTVNYEIQSKAFLVNTQSSNTTGFPINDVALNQEFLLLRGGQNIRIFAKTKTPFFNESTYKFGYKDVYDIDTAEQISEATFEFTSDRKISIRVMTGIENSQDRYNSNNAVVKIAKANAVGLKGVGYTPPVSLQINVVTDTQSGVASNSTLSDGTPSRTFALNMPVNAATDFMFGFYTIPTTARLEVVQSPLLPATGFIAKIAIGTGWSVTSNATLTGIYIFK